MSYDIVASRLTERERSCGGSETYSRTDRQRGADTPPDGDENPLEFGETELFVALVHFEDTEPLGPPEEYRDLLFGDQPGVGASEYSVADYWDAASHGSFTIRSGPGGVAGWYELPYTQKEYLDLETPREELYTVAVEKARADGYDFTEWSDDRMMVAIRSGGGGAGGGGPGGNWAGVQFSGSLEFPADPNIADEQLSFFAHEMGHALGLPHHYGDVGELSLMSGDGTWAAPSSLPCAHEKNSVGLGSSGHDGWTETTDVYMRDGDDDAPPMLLPPAPVVGENYRLWDGQRDDGSRYLLEYRTAEGVDSNLPPEDQGLAVYWYDGELSGDAIDLDEPSQTSTSGDWLSNAGAKLQLEFDDVDTAFDCLQVNGPDRRTVPDGNECVYAVPVDLDDIPPGAAAESASDTRIDARVAWEGGSNETRDVSLELVEPDGSTHARSRDVDFTFDVVRSELLDGDNAVEGGWKLRETVSVSDTDGEDGTAPVDYFRAVTYPTYELATTATLTEATVDGGTLQATVELAFGDGSAYDPGEFGQPTAAQFDLTVAGQSVPTGDISVSAGDAGTYTLEVTDVGASAGDDLSVSFTDEKAGATQTTNTASTSVEPPGLGISA